MYARLIYKIKANLLEIYLSRQLQREDDPVRLSHLKRGIRLVKMDAETMQCLCL
jgi:hypothetical protein